MPFVTMSLLLPLSSLAVAQSNDEIEALREAAKKSFNPGKIGAGYAAIINFAVSPDISTATFHADAGEGIVDPTLKVTRFPFRKVFDKERDGPRPFIGGLFAYQNLDSGFVPLPNEQIDAEWQTYGATLSGGFEIPVGEAWKLFPTLSLGFGSLDNRARYSGPVSETYLRPALQGIVFDWDAKALVYGVAFGASYEYKTPKLGIEALSSLTYHRIQSFDTGTDFQSFRGDVTAFDVELNFVRPTRMKLGKYPLAVVALLGNTTFLGANRDALGFKDFYEAGLALEVDVSSRGWKIHTLRLGAKSIVGSDVHGWSLILSYGY